MVFGLRSLSATFDTVALENQMVDLDQQEAKLKEEMRFRPVTIREDRARVQQTLDAARDFAEPFQTLSGVLLVFVESVGPSLWTGTGLGPMVQGLQRALPPSLPSGRLSLPRSMLLCHQVVLERSLVPLILPWTRETWTPQ